MNGHAPEKGYFLATENRVNGYAPEKGTLERVCSGIWNVLFQFVVFSSSLIPVFRANEHEKRGFEWSTFSLNLKSIYSKVGGYAPEYVRMFIIRLLMSPYRVKFAENTFTLFRSKRYLYSYAFAPIGIPNSLASFDLAITHPSLFDSTTTGLPIKAGLKTRSQEA